MNDLITLDWLLQVGSLANDQALNIFVDEEGNSYTTGFTEGDLVGDNSGGQDLWLAKHDRNGNQIWLQQFGSVKDDFVYGIAVDSEDNVYLAGNTKGILGNRNFGNQDVFIAKYNVNGELDSSFGTDGFSQFGSFGEDEVKSLQLDSQGNIYVTGFTEGTLDGNNAGGRDAWVAKYSNNGTEIWRRQLGSDQDDISYDLVLDINNNIYLTGYTEGAIAGVNPGDYDGWLAKYSNDGTLIWTQQLGTGTETDGYTKAITIDTKGNIFVAGLIKEENNPELFDGWLARYTPSGEEIWQQRISSEAWDSASDVFADSLGNVFVAGETLGNLGGENQGGFDVWAAQYDINGTLIGIEQQTISTEGDDFANGVGFTNLFNEEGNPTGNLYIAGSTTNSDSEETNQAEEDIVISKLSVTSDARQVYISQNIEASPTQTITIPINLTNAAGLLSADIVLEFDATFLTVTEVNLGSLTGEDITDNESVAWSLSANINDPSPISFNGQVNISISSNNPLPISEGSLVELTVEIAEDAPSNLSTSLNLSTVLLNEGALLNGIQDGSVFIQPDILQVTDVILTNTGFEIEFNNSNLNLDVLNLYEIGNLNNPASDLRLTDGNGDFVDGSLLWNEDNKKLTFLATGNVLEAGEYNLTLFSGGERFATKLGTPLDGNNDGQIIPGDDEDFTTTFTVEAFDVSLNLPDFSRGPGQEIDVPADDLVKGLPISLETNQEINNIEFSLTYNPEIIKINGTNLDDELVGVWTINENETDLETPGKAIISLSGNNLSTGIHDLLFVDAEVLEDVTYGITDIITIEDVLINNNSEIKALGDTAIHQVNYLGDVTGNEEYSSLDALEISRVALDLGTDQNTGFEAYPNLDPLIVGNIIDVNPDQKIISGLDSSIITRAALGLVNREIPAIPNSSSTDEEIITVENIPVI